MPLDKPDWRSEETKFLAHTILEVTHERKMQAGFSARGENDEGRGTNAYLGDVLHMQTRAAMRPGRHDARPLSDLPFKEFIQARSRNAHVACLVGLNGERQEPRQALSGQGRNGNYGRPTKKLHLFAHLAFKSRAGMCVFVLDRV